MKSLKPLLPMSAAIMTPMMITSPTAFISMVMIIAFPKNCPGMNSGNRKAK